MNTIRRWLARWGAGSNAATLLGVAAVTSAVTIALTALLLVCPAQAADRPVATPLETLVSDLNDITAQLIGHSVRYHSDENSLEEQCEEGRAAILKTQKQGRAVRQFLVDYPEKKGLVTDKLLEELERTYHIISRSVMIKCGTDHFLHIPEGVL